MAARERLVAGELGTGHVELLLGDDRRDGGDRYPLLRREGHGALVRPLNRVGRGPADLGRAGAPRVHLPSIRRIGEDAAQRGQAAPRPARRRMRRLHRAGKGTLADYRALSLAA